MMAFLAGVIAGVVVAIAYRVVRYAQWQHTLIAYAATISRLHARWIITDTLGTFEGHPMEELVAFLHRYSTTQSTRPTPCSTDTIDGKITQQSWDKLDSYFENHFAEWVKEEARSTPRSTRSTTRSTRTTPRSTTQDATEER